jgi:hypothetical protein
MGTVTVTNQPTVSLTTAMTRGKLQVLSGSVVLGTVIDQYCEGQTVPEKVRLEVAYLPDGTAVSGVWGPNQQAFTDEPSKKRIFAEMPTPTTSNEVDYAFTVSVGAPVPQSDDPHLVLKTNVDC